MAVTGTDSMEETQVLMTGYQKKFIILIIWNIMRSMKGKI
jgi:hypothetical protein